MTRRLILIAIAASTLGACGSGTPVENTSAAENLSFDSAPTNDASALEAVAAEEARAGINDVDEAPAIDNDTESDAASNESANSQ